MSKTIVLLTAFFTATTAYGKPSQGNRVASIKKPTKSGKTETTMYKSSTSSNNRRGKSLYLVAEPLGFTLTPVGGIRAGFFLHRNFVAELGYASNDLGGINLGDTKHLLSAKGKFFVTNSLYLDLGVGYEYWQLEYGVATNNTGESNRQLNGTLTNIGAEGHIGNQWQWSGFTLGCDWAGFFSALVTETSFANDSDLDPEDKNKEEERLQSLFGGDSPHFGRLYLGWAL